MLAVSEAIYCTEWYRTNVQFSRKLLLVLMASQNDLVFTAGGISDVNAAIFTTVNLFLSDS